MYVELDDGIRLFVESKMREVDAQVYNPIEFYMFFNQKHIVLADVDKNGKIIAFCAIMVKSESFKMCYTWCDSTRAGMVAYGRGIEYMITQYAPMEFGPGALKLNKIKRLYT